ncbi:Phospholipase/carboxylesterase [Paxillus ammoniavirescens]|nr:Phospholipase/carboxylesterase [Paxillus ammoniavirescens]
MAASVFGPFEVVRPLAQHTATVIFLHGLGDSGKGWLGIINQFKDQLPHVKWLLPNAPSRSITANLGFVMPGWFDLRSWDLQDQNEDRTGMLESARTIDQYIQGEVDSGIPPGRIVVGGFSQGGAMSLLTALTARAENGVAGGKEGWKLGGVAILSGWTLLQDDFSKMVSPHLTSTPVLMCHGTADSVVPHILSQKTAQILTNQLNMPALENLTLSMQVPPSSYLLEESKMGIAGLSFRSYRSSGHEACERTQEDLKEFLKRVLPQ